MLPFVGSTDERFTRGHRSTSTGDAGLHRVQAAQLPDEQVQAELARQDRVQQVLPLVRQAHAAQGDPLGSTAWRAGTASSRQQGRRSVTAPVAGKPKSQSGGEPVERPSLHPPASSGSSARCAASWPRSDFPNRHQTWQSTSVVIAACVHRRPLPVRARPGVRPPGAEARRPPELTRRTQCFAGT